jgi:hypothetical protein
MAYNRRKIVSYGGVGAAIAIVFILAFLWPPFTEVGLVPIVELESVMPGTLAITVITDTQDIKVTELKLTIDRLEVKPLNGSWSEMELPGGNVSFDLLHRQGTFIATVIGQLEPGTMIRMHIVRQMGKIDQPINQYANATLNNGDVVNVVLPNEYIEVRTPIVIGERVYIVRT